jgi:hypothetical protein
MEWSDVARKTIEAVAATLPDAMTLKERKAAIEAAYPFGPKAYWPRRAWCKARKAYLSRFDSGGLRVGPAARPTGLEHLPRDPTTGRPVIP